VCIGDLDPVTPVAASEEIVAHLRDGIGRLDVVVGAGHFAWLDAPEHCWSLLDRFVAEATGG
jgi:pimeloyl-ACP methyl ester carboxylesterase